MKKKKNKYPSWLVVRPATFYDTCEYCGANLDPGETCDCLEAKREAAAIRSGFTSDEAV